MKLDEKQLQELKQCELRIFESFLQVCKALNLRYYIIGGTLLGAVRHQGFIPWDDDIDIGMPRSDYDIFLKKGQDYLPDDYFLQTFRTDPEWPECFAKIRDCKTTFVESNLKNCKINHGVYIDIFPLDFYPEERHEAGKVELLNKLFRAKINQVFTIPEENKETIIRTVGKKILAFFVSFRYPTLSETLIAREKLIKSVGRSSLLKNYCGAWGKKEIVKYEWFLEGCNLEFEGMHVVGPKNYDAYLKNVYGDYMTLPPEEKRIGHHYVEMFDLKNCLWSG